MFDLYPTSFDVYDSLGEAYMKNGQNDLAMVYYEKSLELNPENVNAKEMLTKLKNLNQKKQNKKLER